MGNCYYLTDKGRKNEPKNPAGKAVLEYCKEGHTPVNSDEIRQMVPGVPSPETELESLYKAGFLGKETEGDNINPLNYMTAGK